MIPVLCVRIPGIGEVRFDRFGSRTFRPEKAKADLAFERLRAVERALIDGCSRRDPSRSEQVETLVRAFPDSTVAVLTHEWPEAPDPRVGDRWRSRWGGQLPSATSE